MLKQAAEKFIGCGGNDTEASVLMYQCQWLYVTDPSVEAQ